MELINNKEELQKALRELIDIIKNVSDEIARGEINELEGLDEKVEIVCASVEKSTQEIAVAIEPLMAEMIACLEVLAGLIRDFQEQLEEEEKDE